VQWINEFSQVFIAANHAEKGTLPHAGGWADQPAKLMRFVDIVMAERVSR